MEKFDVLVRGSGCVGRSLALALGARGFRVALLARPGARKPDADVRAYALNAQSVALLTRLRVWEGLAEDARTPVHDMRIHGDRAGAELHFSAWEQGAGELAHIVDAAALEDQLDAALRFAPHVHRVTEPVPATLQALCEGRDTVAAAELGVDYERHDYGHLGVATRLTASRPHQGQAWQWFRSPDVLALLPFDRPEPGRSYGLVWSLPREQAQRMLAAGPTEFESALLAATGGAAGTLKLAGERQAWPLQLCRADRLCGPGWVLLGDAAHLVHPLAGQGLNLGLADVQALVDVITSRESWRGLGDDKLLRRYARARVAPTWAMGELTDGLLRGFASQVPAIARIRNEGLRLVDRAGPLKKWLTARALGH
ncbi:2-octaprenyl-3-methyl-6-methoxy-1,4-benzoquinol hydroxylase [Roseateles aquatilis]|uniref:2-octaprenyl-3-methyl-6-methoxy-1,4-benzoquinol hydroxylase n=1 Tax=Roseateles aquatilis TaxID=431061 RepID=A0A246J4F8_9BURK|nr:FAD-dependent monooxygenase [Roseateles aquatilis]OWQ87476.1 2-octaprenyl-3-methyl-6-methoxy-1,4-benzoquinol hydroxylase [Roseateles aquatilis]